MLSLTVRANWNHGAQGKAASARIRLRLTFVIEGISSQGQSVHLMVVAFHLPCKGPAG